MTIINYSKLTERDVHGLVSNSLRNAEIQHVDVLVNLEINKAAVAILGEGTSAAQEYESQVLTLTARLAALENGIAMLKTKFAAALTVGTEVPGTPPIAIK